MSHKLRALLAAALALTAIAAIAASAHAADEFRCSVSPCRGKVSTDGTGTTAHQVIIFENGVGGSVSFTCESLRGTAEFISGTDITLGWNKATGEDRNAYDNCKVNGSPGIVWHMNECKYTFTAGATGNAAAGTTDEAEVHLLCPTGQEIEFTIPTSPVCIFKIGPQTLGGTPAKGGVGYHTIEAGTANETITLTMNIKQIVVTTNGNCASFITGSNIEGTITTGNLHITGQNAAGEMAKASFD